MTRILLLLWCFLTVAGVHGQEETLVPITLENVGQLEELTYWQTDARDVSHIAFAPNGTMLATINSDCCAGLGDIRFLSLPSLEIIDVKEIFPEAFSLVFSPDGSLFALSTFEGHLSIYDAHRFEFLQSIEVQSEPAFNLALAPSNQYVAVAFGAPELVTSGDYIFQLLDINTGQTVFSLHRETDSIDEIFGTGIEFDEKGEYVYLSTSDGKLHRWHVETGEREIIADNVARGVQVLQHTHNNHLTYLSSEGIRLIETDQTEGELIFPSEGLQLTSFALHPSEPILAIGFFVQTRDSEGHVRRDGYLLLQTTNTKELVYEQVLASIPGTPDLAFSFDGTILATTWTDGTVRLWGIPAGE